MSQRLISVLEIPAGDVNVLNDNGSPMAAMRIASHLDVLGLSNVAQGRLEDLSCGTTKFKVSAEVMLDACAVAVQKPSVRAKLFPSGMQDFKPVYMALIGRKPTDFEVSVLRDLALALPGSPKSEAAVCGAVASSLESLIRI